jgi:glycosyltransferase involved in cell wall biosynthesis
MIRDKSIAVVMPAYNAEKTLESTFREIPLDIVDHIILVDDRSSDHTVALAKELGIKHIIEHEENKGYGGNQKSCYQKALDLNADIVVMLHPDYQYDPRLIHSMCYLIANGVYEVVLGSRILGRGALKGGMPMYKYVANRFLTVFQNLMIRQKLSEYHTGYRAFSANVLRKVNFQANSDDFVFDNQMLAQIFYQGFEIAEITCPTKYFEEASSINVRRSIRYGMGVMMVSIRYFLARMGILRSRIFMQEPGQ